MKVLITGGTRGIGLQASLLFLEAGHTVYAISRNASQCTIKHENLYCIDFDLVNYDTFGLLGINEIDVLVNNSGIMNGVGYEEYTNEKKEYLMAINVDAPVYLISYFSDYMKKKGGRIISIGSIAGHIGHKDIRYGISKAAVHNFTKSFAKQLGQYNIQVNCIAPGPVNTSMLDTIPEKRKEGLKKASTSGRFAEPKEIAETVLRLGTKAPAYINGICIDVKDGMHFRS